MNYTHVIKASYGNDSIALIQHMHENPIGCLLGEAKIAVLYNDTGWASDEWPARVERGEALARSGTELDESHVPALRAMALASDDDFYSEIADTIEKVGPVRIWATY